MSSDLTVIQPFNRLEISIVIACLDQVKPPVSCVSGTCINNDSLYITCEACEEVRLIAYEARTIRTKLIQSYVEAFQQ